MNCSTTRQRINVWLVFGLPLGITMFHSPSRSTVATAR